MFTITTNSGNKVQFRNSAGFIEFDFNRRPKKPKVCDKGNAALVEVETMSTTYILRALDIKEALKNLPSTKSMNATAKADTLALRAALKGELETLTRVIRDLHKLAKHFR